MSDIPEKQRGVSWLVTLGAVLLLAAYVGGYFVLCERTTYAIPNFTAAPPVVEPFPNAARHYLKFTHPVMVSAYIPLGWLEAKIRRDYVAMWAEADGKQKGIRFQP